MYYFYRYLECPPNKTKLPLADKTAMAGGVVSIAASARGKLKPIGGGEGSERLLMFSNHGTRFDDDDVCAESFLYTSQVLSLAGGDGGWGFRGVWRSAER